MQTVAHRSQPNGTRPSRDEQKNLVTLTLSRLAELDRLRVAGLAKAERLTVVAEGLTPLEEYKRMVGPKGTLQTFDAVAKAVRQVVVLEFELRGLFKAPDRESDFRPRLGRENLLGDLYDDYDDDDDDYDDCDDLFDFDRSRRSLLDLNSLRARLDYDKGPLVDLIADIRKTLGVEAPADDPFAPQAPRRVQVNGLRDRLAARVADEKGAEIKAAPAPREKPRPPAMQLRPVVKTAAPALPRKGFRIPPTSSHNPKTPPGQGKHRRNRGPPR